MPSFEHILIDPRICHGKPVIRGTRVPIGCNPPSAPLNPSLSSVGDRYRLR
jgi:hypothetical protein